MDFGQWKRLVYGFWFVKYHDFRTHCTMTLLLPSGRRMAERESSKKKFLKLVTPSDAAQRLTNAGFDCVGMASSAAAALELAEQHRPDLILMDIRLANGGDGVQWPSWARPAILTRYLLAAALDCTDWPALTGPRRKPEFSAQRATRELSNA